MTTKEFAKILQDKLTSEYGVDLSVASHQQIYRALALICRQIMSENHKKFQSKAIGTGSKQVYYLCMEFLMGRSLKMSLFNLGLNDIIQAQIEQAHLQAAAHQELHAQVVHLLGAGADGLGLELLMVLAHYLAADEGQSAVDLLMRCNAQVNTIFAGELVLKNFCKFFCSHK